MQGAAPGEPLVAGARGLVVDVVHAEAVEGAVQIVNALVHAGRLVGADAEVEEMVVVVDGGRIHLAVAAVAGAAAGAAEAADPAEEFRMVQADGVGLV